MTPNFTAYVQHGTGTDGPFQAEKAQARYSPTPTVNPHRPGPLPTNWEVRTAGKWRRLHMHISANPRYFVRIDRAMVPVTVVGNA